MKWFVRICLNMDFGPFPPSGHAPGRGLHFQADHGGQRLAGPDGNQANNMPKTSEGALSLSSAAHQPEALVSEGLANAWV